MSRFLLLMRSNWITATGAVITTLSFMAFVTTLVYMSLHGSAHGAYFGLFTFLLLPMVFVLGIALIPLGLLVYRGQLRQRMDLLTNKPMRLVRVLAVLTLVNFATVGTAGYEAVHYMDSPQFCGKVCHPVMTPTYEMSLDAPHSRIACVECHIGPGVDAFVTAKLSGMRQLAAVAFDTYERPIPVPVHRMRGAEQICETCHQSQRVVEDRMIVRHHFDEDEAVTRSTNVLLLKMGGTRPDGTAHGIHWHANKAHTVSYVSAGKREQIDWIRYVAADGTEKIFTLDGEDPAKRPEGELRTMDCVDCHNHPGHYQQEPGDAVDLAIAAGRIPRELPSIKKLAMAVLQQPWQRETARAAIRAELERVYAQNGGLDAGRREQLAKAADSIADIWLRNVFPEMNVTWGTYPNFTGHRGCMRCHDGNHMTSDGEVLTFDCAQCHAVLAQQAQDPQVLQQFGIEGR